jgi:hypothetical protein
VAAHIGNTNGYLTYCMWVLGPDKNINMVIVDPANGRVLLNRGISIQHGSWNDGHGSWNDGPWRHDGSRHGNGGDGCGSRNDVVINCVKVRGENPLFLY